MDRHLLITGQGRAGSTLFYSMMQHTLQGFFMPDGEVSAAGLLSEPGNTCSKRPFDIFYVNEIMKVAPRFKKVDLILTLRDPRDILTSVHKRVPDDYFCAADHCYGVPKDGKPVRNMPGLLPIHYAMVDVMQSGHFPQGVFILKYEDLVADPDAVQAMLAEAFDLSFRGSFQEFYTREVKDENAAAMNGLRPLDPSRLQKWRRPEHRDRIIDQFTRFPELFDVVTGLGYEPNNSWYDGFLGNARITA